MIDDSELERAAEEYAEAKRPTMDDEFEGMFVNECRYPHEYRYDTETAFIAGARWTESNRETTSKVSGREWWVEILKPAILPQNRIARAFDADQMVIGREHDPEFDRRNWIHVREVTQDPVTLTTDSVNTNELWFKANYEASEGALKLTLCRLEAAQTRIQELEQEVNRLTFELDLSREKHMQKYADIQARAQGLVEALKVYANSECHSCCMEHGYSPEAGSNDYDDGEKAKEALAKWEGNLHFRNLDKILKEQKQFTRELKETFAAAQQEKENE